MTGFGIFFHDCDFPFSMINDASHHNSSLTLSGIIAHRLKDTYHFVYHICTSILGDLDIIIAVRPSETRAC